jgi:hypothetical protein
MVTIEKVKKGLANFADREIISKIPDVGKKILVGAALSLYLSNLENLIMQYKDNAFVAALGVIHPDGGIDIERLAEAVKPHIPEDGAQINVDVIGLHLADMKLHRSDIDNIVAHIINA